MDHKLKDTWELFSATLLILHMRPSVLWIKDLLGDKQLRNYRDEI